MLFIIYASRSKNEKMKKNKKHLGHFCQKNTFRKWIAQVEFAKKNISFPPFEFFAFHDHSPAINENFCLRITLPLKRDHFKKVKCHLSTSFNHQSSGDMLVFGGSRKKKSPLKSDGALFRLELLHLEGPPPLTFLNFEFPSLTDSSPFEKKTLLLYGYSKLYISGQIIIIHHHPSDLCRGPAASCATHRSLEEGIASVPE